MRCWLLATFIRPQLVLYLNSLLLPTFYCFIMIFLFILDVHLQCRYTERNLNMFGAKKFIRIATENDFNINLKSQHMFLKQFKNGLRVKSHILNCRTIRTQQWVTNWPNHWTQNLDKFTFSLKFMFSNNKSPLVKISSVWSSKT